MAPGSYKKIRLERNAILGLSSGHYHIQKIEADRGALIEIDLSSGPIIINVVKDINLRDNVEITTTYPSGSDGARDILIQVGGSTVNLGKNGHFLGTFLVPRGEIVLKQGSVLTGAIYGKKVRLKSSAHVFPDPALELLVDASADWLGKSKCPDSDDDRDDDESEDNDGEDDGNDD